MHKHASLSKGCNLVFVVLEPLRKHFNLKSASASRQVGFLPHYHMQSAAHHYTHGCYIRIQQCPALELKALIASQLAVILLQVKF